MAQRTALLPLLLSGLLALPATAQRKEKQPELTRILFVMDASNSMNAFWGTEPKIVAARKILLESLKPIEDVPGIEIALRLYGHQTRIEPGKQDCDDTKLEVPFAPRNGKAIRDKMNSVYCLGTTPIARSLEKAASDFPDRKARNVIILITDGIEACDEDPCAVSRALQAKGITLKPFVIGVGIDESSAYNLKCVGNYYDASTPELFDRVLKVVIDQALNSTTTQLLLLTDDSKPTETDVPVTFYDQRTGQQRYNFVHTMNARGFPDTLSIDPVFTYRIVAHTVPPSMKENVTVEAGKHNVIALVAGQGQLDLRTESAVTSDNEVQCLVRKAGSTEIINVQRMNTGDRYLTGSYDLEFLTLPRLAVPGVQVKQSITTPVRIPQSGVLNVNAATPSIGAIFLKKGDALEWVVDLDPTVARNQFRLLPGDYKVVLRSARAQQTLFSIEKDLTVRSATATTIDL
ncbi:MAG TPA: VWA domain-containing protein [Flavobacteriales bacterium]